MNEMTEDTNVKESEKDPLAGKQEKGQVEKEDKPAIGNINSKI